ALAQLGGGGGGVGDHQDLRHRQLALQQQAGVQRGEGPGLAGTGAGLDQRTAGEGRLVQVQVAHSASSSLAARALSAGPSNCSASCSKRSPRGSRSRKARAYQGSVHSPASGLNSAPSQAALALSRAASMGSLWLLALGVTSALANS